MTDLRDQLQSTLGDAYSVERELGRGGMSRVFVAEEKTLGRKVVVKMLSCGPGARLSAERFAREVRFAASLQHPNIVPVLLTGSVDDAPYYTMPYVKGDSLRTRLDQPPPLPRREAVSILRDVARALLFAHNEGVIHRDIKPDNVLLAGDAALVTDFGIAKAISAARTDDGHREAEDTGTMLTIAGTSIGTPAYMSPEQISADKLDHRVDIYAWGVVAYEIFAASHPFKGCTSAQQYMVAHLSQTPPALAERAADLSPAIAALVMRCLQKNPNERPESAAELLDALEGASTSGGGHATIPAVQRVESIRAPRSRFRLMGASLVLAAAAAAAIVYGVSTRDGTASGPVSLAVLPFVDATADSANAYFGEGIADELMGALAKVPGLRVASRTSSFVLAEKADLDVREIAERLGVAAVVEGTVRRAGGRLRVSAQLTNASDGLTLWSETYERENKDVFAVQDEIARSIAAALRPELARDSPASARTGTSGGTTNPEAYDLYLRGLYLLERRGAGVTRSAEYFTQAIAKDPRFARAHAGLASALSFFSYFAGIPPARIETRVIEASRRALALDPTLAEPRVALAMAHMHAFRWNEADAEFRRAIAADSTSATAHTQYGRYLLAVGRISEALERFRKARVLDPLAGTSSVWLSHTLSLSGQDEAAWVESKRARELDPNLITSQTILALDRVGAGRPDQAGQIAAGSRPPVPFNGMVAYAMQLSGDRVRAASIRKELDSMPDTTWMVHAGRAYAHLAMGDTTKVFEELEAAHRAGETVPNWYPLGSRMFDPVRRSARFARLVNAYGLDARVFTAPTGGRPGR